MLKSRLSPGSQRRQGGDGKREGSPDGTQHPLLPHGSQHNLLHGARRMLMHEESRSEDTEKLRQAFESLESAYVHNGQRLARLEESVLSGDLDGARQLCDARKVAPSVAKPACVEEFNVAVDRTAGEKLGVRWRAVRSDGGDFLFIAEETDGGVIQQWNDLHPTRALKPGDRIVEVNGISDDVNQLRNEINQHQVLELKVKRGQEFQAEGVVQFDSAVMYAEEGESLTIHIMRLGGLDSACSVDYGTDSSERWSHMCEALQGTVHFKPGERTKTITLNFFEDEVYQGSTVEVSVRLSNPLGCVLGILKRVRVKMLDDDTFPTNKFAEDIKRDYSARSWRDGRNVSMLVEFYKFVFMHTTRGSMKLIVAGQVENLIYILELWMMKEIVNALDYESGANPPTFLYVTTLALCLLIPFGLTHLISYQSKGWGVGGGARKVLLESLMASFLNFEEENRHKLDSYDWTTVFSVEIMTLVDGYMELFRLIAAIGKVVFLALFMTCMAFRSYFATGEKALFVSIVPFVVMPPIIYSYLALRFRGAEQVRQDVVAASASLRRFAGECVLHYRMVADYWSRPVVLTQTMMLTHDLNRNLTARSKRKANDGAFFGWLMKLIEFGAIVGLCEVVICGGIKIGTFTAVLSGLKSAGNEFRGAYYTVMRMQACFPCLWKCVGYMNMPNDLWQRRDKLSEVRRWFADSVQTGEPLSPGEVPEDNVPLTIGNITFTYKGGSSHIFRDLTVEFNQGEFVALVGPHNSGKNTLLQILCGLILPSSGSSRVPPHLRVLHLSYERQVWDRPLSDTLYYGWMATHGVARVEDLDEQTIEKGLDVCRQLELHQDILDLIEREARSRANPSIKGNDKFTDRTGLTTDSSYKLQLACALLAHPEVLVIHKPVAHASWTDGALIMDVLRRYVDERGICNPAVGGLLHLRRPRTCIVSMEKPIFLEKVHRVYEVNGGQVSENRGWYHRQSRSDLDEDDAKGAGRPPKE